MAEETTTAPAGMEPAAGGTGTPAPVAATHDKGDYKARLSHEPDFAANEVTRLTGELEKAKQSTKSADPIIAMANTVSPGNVEQGVKILESAIQAYSRMSSDPQMSKHVHKFLNEGVAPGATLDTDAQSAADDLYADDLKNSSVIRELQSELASLRGQTAQQTAQQSLQDFFDNDETGAALNQDERGEVLGEIMASVQNAQTSGNTDLLRSLTKDTVRTIAANWMSRTGKLGDVGERIARARAETKQAAGMESPSPLGTVPTEPNYSKTSVSDAVAQFAKENGVNLWEPKIR